MDKERVEVRAVILNKMPLSCGECPLMQYIDDQAVCVGLPQEHWELYGNPYAMTYRRSDCPALTMAFDMSAIAAAPRIVNELEVYKAIRNCESGDSFEFNQGLLAAMNAVERLYGRASND